MKIVILIIFIIFLTFNFIINRQIFIQAKNIKQFVSLTMGINSSQAALNQSDFNINDWDNILFEAGSRILANRRNPYLQIQQHTIIVSNQRDLELAQQLFFLRKHHPSIVNAYHYQIFDLNRSPHHQTFTGLLYTERIHTKLIHMNPVSFPDCLHLIAQAIYGFEKLAQFFNCFKVNGSCIGVNCQKIVKVWHNPNYSSIYPYQSAFSQQQMILSILETLQPFIDEFTMPRQQPNFKKFVQKQIKYLNFDIVKAKLIEYSRIFNNGYIPTKLQYIELQKKPTTVRYPNPSTSQNLKYTHQNNLNQSLAYNQVYTQPNNQNRYQQYQQFQPINYIDPNKINYFPPLQLHGFNDNRGYIIPTPQPRPLQIQTERTMIISNPINQPYIRNSQIKPIYQNVSKPVSYIQPNLSPNFNTIPSPPLVIKQSTIGQPSFINYSHQNQQQFNLNLQNVRYISGVNSVNRNLIGHSRQPSISDKNSIKSNEFRNQFNYRPDSINENTFKPMSTLHPIINRSSSVQNHLYAIQKKPKSFRQRSHSEMNRFFKDQMNSTLPFEQKKSIIRLHSQEDQQVSTNIHRQLKPLSIKQSIQGLQYKKTNSPGSNLHQSNLHRIPISPQTQRINRPQTDKSYIRNSVTKNQNNEYDHLFQQNAAYGNFKTNNMAKQVKLSILIPQSMNQYHEKVDNYRSDDWPHPQNFSFPYQHQSHKISLIKLSKVQMQQESNTEKYNENNNFYQRDPVNYQYQNKYGLQPTNPVQKVHIPNLYPSFEITEPNRNNNAQYYNFSQVHSVNNSVQNFHPNNLSQNYSQVVDFNNSMDFRLGRKQNNPYPYHRAQQEDKQIMGNQHLTDSKIFSQQKQSKGVTSLDLMSKLKITTTITKDEQNYDKLPLIIQQKQKQKKKSKLPEGTRQFSRDVAKLGFHMHSQQSSINDIQSPVQKQKEQKQQGEKKNVKQWTLSFSDYNTPKQHTNEKQKQKSLTYEQLLQSYNFNNYIRSHENKINFRTEQKQYENPTYNHTYADQQEYKYDITSSYRNKPLTSSSSSKQYYNTFSKITAQVTNQQKDSDYKFDWDPEILADLQSKAYKQSYQ